MRRPFCLLILLVATFATRSVSAQSFTPPWVDLGYALAGTNGTPLFVPKGTLAAGSVVELSVTNCPVSQHAYLVIGLSTLYAPYKGGILVPNFDLLFQYSTGLTGSVKLIAHWPPGVPSGTPIIMQFWIDDEGAPVGRAGSNAVGALTP